MCAYVCVCETHTDTEMRVTLLVGIHLKCSQQLPGSRNFSQVSHTMSKTQTVEPLSTASQGVHSQKAKLKTE